MPTVTFHPGGISADVPEGTSLIDAARLAEASLEAPCGGRGTCGGCSVRLVSGSVESSLSGSLPSNVLDEGHVLACHSRVRSQDVTVYVPQVHGLESGPTPSMTEDTDLLEAGTFPTDRVPLAVGAFGLAVDLGTTTVAVKILRLPSGEVVSSFVDYNSQVRCGADVVSRMEYALRPGGLSELKRRALKTINTLTEAAAQRANLELKDITSAVVAGNPTMIHLLLGIDPNYMRQEVDPVKIVSLNKKASEMGLNIAPHAPVYCPPAVGNYVGGDVMAGMLATALAKPTGKLHMLLDIGTNGEAVVGDGGFYLACACSAGPAFEGGGLDHGMRAAPGAVDKVTVDKATGRATFTTIGGLKARGLCGSGVLTLLSELYQTGYLDSGGRLNTDKGSPYIVPQGRKAYYIVAPASETDIGSDLTLSETDIESILRAKAAMYAACTLLLDKVGASFSDLERIYIGGGFGRTLDFEKAIILGLLPDVDRDKFRYIGNSSLTGASMLLVSKEARDKMAEMPGLVQYLDLSPECHYYEHFTAALFIPHTEARLFPSVPWNGWNL